MALSLGERSFTHGSEWMRLGFGLDGCLVGELGVVFFWGLWLGFYFPGALRMLVEVNATRLVRISSRLREGDFDGDKGSMALSSCASK